MASTRLFLTTWLNSWKSISQPVNLAHFLIPPFSVFPLYAHTRSVKGHFLMLRRQSGTLSLTKSGYLTPSHPSNHHLKLFSQQSYWLCVGGGGERGGERERERQRKRELVVYCKVWEVFFVVVVLFRVMGLALRRRNDTEKNTLLLLSLNIRPTWKDTPSYLSDLLQLQRPSGSLCSSREALILPVPKYNRKTTGDHSFSQFAAKSWGPPFRQQTREHPKHCQSQT